LSDAESQDQSAVVPMTPAALKGGPVACDWNSPFTPDGQYILVADDESRLALVSVRDVKTTIEIATRRGWHAVGSANPGQLVLFQAVDASHVELTYLRIDGRHRRAVPARVKSLRVPARTGSGEGLKIQRLLFSANGEALAVVSARSTANSNDYWSAQVFNLARGEWCWQTPVGAHFMGISPDGKRAAVSDAAGQVELWDLERGRPLSTLRFTMAWAGHVLNGNWTIAVKQLTTRTLEPNTTNPVIHVWSAPLVGGATKVRPGPHKTGTK
jgi:WD40 repeat protein